MNPTLPTTPDSAAGGSTKIRRRGLAVGVSAGLLGGLAAGFALGVPGVTSAADSGSTGGPAGLVAQVDESGDTATDDADDDASADRGRRGHKGASLTTMAETIGIDVEALAAELQNGATPAEVAEANGVSEADLIAGLVAAAEERLAEAVADGRIAEERAAEVTENLDERITTAVNRGYEGEGRREARQDRREGRQDVRQEAVAELLGVDVDTVVAELRNGSTLVEIAEANGVSEAELVDTLTAGAEERLAEAVENGRIDAERAAEATAELEERVTARVNGERPERPERGERGDRFGRGGPGGASAEASADAEG